MSLDVPENGTRVLERAAKAQAQQTEVLEKVVGGPDDIVTVELVEGILVRVLPARMWRLSGYAAIKEGDFLTWAKKCLASSADYDAFVEADPTFEEINTFFTRFGEGGTEPSGQAGNPGNSNSSSSSSARSKRSRKS